MVVVGNVAHPAVTGEEYRVKSLDNSGRPVYVTADGHGRLWLIVATDSGFEGLSAFYYGRIACTLTPEPQESEASLLGFDQSSVRWMSSFALAGQATADGPLGDEVEPDFALIQPRGLGGVVVHHRMDVQVRRDVPFQYGAGNWRDSWCRFSRLHWARTRAVSVSRAANWVDVS